MVSLFASDVAAAQRDTTPELPPFRTFRDCPDCREVVVLPPGSFEMGSADHEPEERPEHRVTIGYSFAIGRGEVTGAEWAACVRDGRCEAITDGDTRSPHHPQDMVSWDQAEVYLNWLSERTGHRYRLPSEAEWEYAARGGTDTVYWWGGAFKYNQANCKGCDPHQGVAYATPAGTFPANPFGLYDVSGNLNEWTADCWNPDHTGAPGDGSAQMTGECHLRVIRGGSRFSSWYYIRPANRYRINRPALNNGMGFRVVREMP